MFIQKFIVAASNAEFKKHALKFNLINLILFSLMHMSYIYWIE